MTDPVAAESWAVRRAKRFRRGGAAQGDADEEEARQTTTAQAAAIAGTADETLGRQFGELAMQQDEKDILVSAPGKVIMFGEHAVVHGVVR